MGGRAAQLHAARPLITRLALAVLLVGVAIGAVRAVVVTLWALPACVIVVVLLAVFASRYR